MLLWKFGIGDKKQHLRSLVFLIYVQVEHEIPGVEGPALKAAGGKR